MIISSLFKLTSLTVLLGQASNAFNQPCHVDFRSPPRPFVKLWMSDISTVENMPNLRDHGVVPLISSDASIEEDAFNAIDSSVQVNGASEAAGVLSPPITPKRENVPWERVQQRFVRRLNTHEDFMSVHKISAALWLLSLMHITAVGLMHQFSDIPDSLQWSTWIALVTSCIQGITGYDMAVKYRANDPLVQRGMINTSFQIVSTAFAAFYISPFAPEAFNDFQFGNGLMVATIAPSVIMGLDEVLKMKQTMEKRRLRKKEPFSSSPGQKDFGMVGDFGSYGFASLSGFAFSLMALTIAADPSHDRAWILNAASNGVFSCQTFIPENYYALTLFDLAIGVGIFAITLRDKKLIDKSVEQTLVAIFTLPAAFFSLHPFF